MITIKGKYTTAYVLVDYIEPACQAQLVQIVNHPAFINPIYVMPDTHSGEGAVIGFTMKLGDRLSPSIVGYDINCGLLGFELSPSILKGLSLERFEDQIRQRVPFGIEVRDEPIYNFEKKFPWEYAHAWLAAWRTKLGASFNPRQFNYHWFLKKCEQIRANPKRVECSIGTVGGGNHFVEVGIRQKTGNPWIVVHTGSRQFGKLICRYWQNEPALRKQKERKEALGAEIMKLRESDIDRRKIPEEIKKLREKLGMDGPGSNNAMASLDGNELTGYLIDMCFTQVYAAQNRWMIISEIYKILGERAVDQGVMVETVHNYINPEDLIIRKGAVSANKGEKLLLPFNMEEGMLLCEGKGNPDWNSSAPHGAGRLLARGVAKRTLNLEEYKARMKAKGIYSTSVNQKTLDEAPMAYKDPKMIEEAVQPTVTVLDRIVPIISMKDGTGEEED